MIRPLLIAKPMLAFLMLTACEPQYKARQDIVTIGLSEMIVSQSTAPNLTKDGPCWGLTTQPAIYETVTAQVLVAPALYDTDDTLIRPAVYSTRTRQQVVRERAELWFRTPCPARVDLAFVATLQRALTVRGYYKGPITGVIDQPTRAALRAYQTPRGLVSEQLALTTAQQLGVIAF